MQDRTVAIILTIVAVFLCGCPGLAFLCFGLTDFIDYYALNSYIFGISNRYVANGWGIAGICVGVIFIAITVVVGVLTLRRKRETPPPPTDEPIPPAV